MVLVLTAWSGGQIPEWALLTKSLHEKYCEHHGYEYQFHRVDESDLKLPDGGSISPTWAKVLVLQNAIRAADVEWVFWIDLDSFFTQLSVSLEDLLDKRPLPRRRTVFTGDRNDVANTGHLLFPVSNTSLKFVEDWWNTREFTWPTLDTTHQDLATGLVHDQPAFNYLISGGKPDQERVSSEGYVRFNRYNFYPGNPNRNKDNLGRFFGGSERYLEARSRALLPRENRRNFRVVRQSRLNWYPHENGGRDIQGEGPIAHYPGNHKKFIRDDVANLFELRFS